MKYEDFRLLMQVIHMLREWKRWNILPKALKVDSSPPLSHSDHYPNQPIPTFRSALKRNKPISKSVTEEEPSGCFPAMMAWDVLRQLYWYCGSDRRVLSFLCRHCGATIRIYPNNKDNIIPEIKHWIRWRKKKTSFPEQNWEQFRGISRQRSSLN